jgi:hypothetical protein
MSRVGDDETTMSVTVSINGTEENPFAKWGLLCNPFPQIAEAEFVAGCMQLNKLAAGPVRSVEQIREILTGFSVEFVELACEKYKPGERVTYVVDFPRARRR